MSHRPRPTPPQSPPPLQSPPLHQNPPSDRRPRRPAHSCTVEPASATKCDDARQTQSFPQRSTFSSLLLLSFFPLLPFSSSSSSLFSLNFRLLRRSCPYSVLPLAPSAPCRLPRLHVGSLDYCRLVLYNIDITAAPQAVVPLLCPPDPFTRIRARPSWTSKLGMKIPLLLSYYG